MQKEELKSYYEQRGLSKKDLDFAFEILECFQSDINPTNIDEAKTKDIDRAIEGSLGGRFDAFSILLALGRYFKVAKKNNLYVHITKYLGKIGVLESIKERLCSLEGKSSVDLVFSEWEIPPLGTSPESMPGHLERFMDRLEAVLPDEKLKRVLAYNHHRIPKEAFEEEKRRYDESSTLEEYLLDLHKRSVKELQQHCDEDKVWYEQIITQRVVDYVDAHPDIQSAILKDDKLYVRKIPYDTEAFLNASTPREKAYHACHCPFAKEAILNDSVRISSNWCHCSGGFTKHQFEVLFGQELPVKSLELALRGDLFCRFEISLEGVDYKR